MSRQETCGVRGCAMSPFLDTGLCLDHQPERRFRLDGGALLAWVSLLAFDVLIAVALCAWFGLIPLPNH